MVHGFFLMDGVPDSAADRLTTPASFSVLT